MSAEKVTISIDKGLLAEIDNLVRTRVFSNRSQAIQVAVGEKIARHQKTQLARECTKLDPQFEQVLADEGIGDEAGAWPEY